ncbi:MAG TPA: hypothetical protein VFQ25_10295 [Ktedonobacterales bacterium]|nr:hypothetical protein [Ktedonobacterales bacterium]
MGVQISGRRSLGRRATVMVAIPALVLAIALGGCRASGARNGGNGNSNVPVTQSTSGSGSSSTATTSNSGGGGSNAALQQLESVDSQNQTDQQQLGSAGSAASVDYSSQDNSIQP